MFWKKSKWSKAPGCFERHLQRREGNALFPTERRRISGEEVAQARKKDEIDQQRFIQSIRNLENELENSQDTNPSSTLHDSSALQKIQTLLEEASSIGGNIQNEIHLLEATEENIIQRLNKSMPAGKDLLEKAKSISMTARIPIIALLKRSDTPILPGEEVPTILSEDHSTISVIGFISRSFPDFKPCEADIRKHIDIAAQQGLSQERAQEILNSWNETKFEIP
jgi:hypothetical protein